MVSQCLSLQQTTAGHFLWLLSIFRLCNAFTVSPRDNLPEACWNSWVSLSYEHQSSCLYLEVGSIVEASEVPAVPPPPQQGTMQFILVNSLRYGQKNMAVWLTPERCESWNRLHCLHRCPLALIGSFSILEDDLKLLSIRVLMYKVEMTLLGMVVSGK